MNIIISQALATGLPVITTRHSGLPEQVVDGENGFLVDEGDYLSLAEAILFFMDHAEIWARLSAAGRRHVKENYNAHTLLDKQISCYEEVIGVSREADS